MTAYAGPFELKAFIRISSLSLGDGTLVLRCQLLFWVKGDTVTTKELPRHVARVTQRLATMTFG